MAKEFLVGKAAASEYGLDDWMFNSFSDIVNFYSQQKQSLIASRFPIKTFRGKSTTIQGVKETNVKKRIRTEYKGETPDMTISRDRRWIFLSCLSGVNCIMMLKIYSLLLTLKVQICRTYCMLLDGSMMNRQWLHLKETLFRAKQAQTLSSGMTNRQ